tara:strand:+ start:1631 stop:2380 length:750 start_codon:yes stop_codon:yes gene_type:complete
MENKFLKKIVNFFGYKLINKKHIKNNRILSSNSVLKIDAILKNIFEKHNIKNVLQIGANDGISFDELNYFIKKYKSKSILVEPIQQIFLKLKENYKNFENVIFDNSAIISDEKNSYLFKVNEKFLDKYGNHIPAISSFDKQHLINHGVKNSHIVKEKVNSLTIKDLISKHSIRNLDLFFVDAEGYDGKIVYDLLTQSDLRPIIIFEYIHIQNNFFRKLINLFISKNFLYFSIGECIISFPKEKKIEISF